MLASFTLVDNLIDAPFVPLIQLRLLICHVLSEHRFLPNNLHLSFESSDFHLKQTNDEQKGRLAYYSKCCKPSCIAIYRKKYKQSKCIRIKVEWLRRINSSTGGRRFIKMFVYCLNKIKTPYDKSMKFWNFLYKIL